jgi:hypothetical protein
MPLVELMADDMEDPEAARAALAILQESLSAEVGRPITWPERLTGAWESEADQVDPEALWALRAAAATLELRQSLHGFETVDEPWDHPAILELEEAGGSKRFPHLLHADAPLVAYVPAELANVYYLSFSGEETAEAEEEEEEDVDLATGSLPGLTQELSELREALELPLTMNPDEELAFDEEADTLASAKFACAVLSIRADEATRSTTPLMLIFVGEEPEEASDDDA